MVVPLRVHGHHSMLTGVDAPRVLCERARELGFAALALCDVDTQSGLVDFLKAAERTGVRPIVGAEISDPSGLPGRVVALVENERGWKNLCKLVSARQLGPDPGVAGAVLAGPEHFDLVQQASLHQEGLVFLVDHPRLVLALAGRVDARSLFVAISPASLRTKSTRRERDHLPRNVARAPRSAGIEADRHAADELDGPPRDVEELLDTPKVPAPEPPVPAQDLLDAARAVGIATDRKSVV